MEPDTAPTSATWASGLWTTAKAVTSKQPVRQTQADVHSTLGQQLTRKKMPLQLSKKEKCCFGRLPISQFVPWFSMDRSVRGPSLGFAEIRRWIRIWFWFVAWVGVIDYIHWRYFGCLTRNLRLKWATSISNRIEHLESAYNFGTSFFFFFLVYVYF